MNRWRTLVTIVVLSIAGCGSKMPTAADPQLARRSLVRALDTWRNGEPLDSLQKGSPAIYFNDELWQSNRRLQDYEIGAEQANGQGWRCEVKLTLSEDPSYAPRSVNYVIDTSPNIVIVQQP